MHIEKEFKNGFLINIWETLSEIFLWKKFNWNTWQFINIEFENDIMTGAYEIMFVLLCCGIRIRIPHETNKSKKFWKDIKQQKNYLSQSCYGYVNKKDYNLFKNNNDWEGLHIIVFKLRKYLTNPRNYKKIFIQ
jgi:hypothetical protein